MCLSWRPGDGGGAEGGSADVVEGVGLAEGGLVEAAVFQDGSEDGGEGEEAVDPITLVTTKFSIPPYYEIYIVVCDVPSRDYFNEDDSKIVASLL